MRQSSRNNARHSGHVTQHGIVGGPEGRGGDGAAHLGGLNLSCERGI